MVFALAATAISDGYRLDPHESVGSTNGLALDYARNGDAGKLWVVSAKQESGRGRRGRAWATPEGNLAATLLLTSTRDLKDAATLGFVAGLALADALDAVVPSADISIGIDGNDDRAGSRFELKWPNDVLSGRAKLAGILLESTTIGLSQSAIAIGIGVNVVAYPNDLSYPATSLRALGADCGAEALFVALSDAWSVNYRIWDDGRGLGGIRTRWLKRAAGLGGDVAVKVDGEVIRGVFETIDEDCRFVIRDRSDNIIKITAGDVHFGAVASATAV